MYYAVEEFLGIDGEAIEFEWNILPGFTTLQILQQTQNDLQSKNIEPEQFPDRVIFMSMFNDTDWTKRNIEETCASNSEKVTLYAQRFPQGHWTFIGHGEGMKWYGTRDYKPEGKLDSIASKTVQTFQETKHPVFTSVSALNRKF